LRKLTVLPSLAVLAFAFTFNLASHAEASGGGAQVHALVTQKIDETRYVALRGNVRPEVGGQHDRGLVADSLPMEHMLLLLKRSPTQERDLANLIEELHTPGSPNYQNWLSAEQFGQRFGLAQKDIDTITAWLQVHGFTVNQVQPGRTLIDFSGTAAQVREAFHTEMHALQVNGAAHVANVRDPEIPAALAPAIAGIASLNDFRPRAMHHSVARSHVDPRSGSLVSAPASGIQPEYTFSSGGYQYQAVVPADLATIYNLNPLFSAGITGTGQTIVVIEDTNVYSTADWTKFRSTFGLSKYTSGKFTQVHPGSGCTNPGANGNDDEAILDAEWASAGAPNATIELASCADTFTTFGGLIALTNLVNSSTPPPIVSISYGECEANNGASANAVYSSTYQQAVAEGMSVFVSSGDDNAASCDARQTSASHGIGVSGFASTAYDVAVGGTDFSDTYAGTNSTYWNSSNTSTYGSAKSYIPEIPWNNSCAGTLLAQYVSGSSVTYGANGFCNTSTGEQFLAVSGGSGGPSNCATGTPSIAGVASGTCKGWPKPSWQLVYGNHGDGVREIPDVSLFAANGLWGHYYVFCFSDPNNNGAPCSGAPSNWSGAGGTSFAAPIVAAFQALVNQKMGAKQGNPNYYYYKLAQKEFGASGSASCNSTKGKGVASSCTFYDVTQGDIDVNCRGRSCYDATSTLNGVLSTNSTKYAPAYVTTTGWDYATGIGTINAYNLVNNWSTIAPAKK
jgi:subtilase family serine protease